MAKRIFSNYNWTPGTTADAVALTSGQYMALKGGAATQIIDVLDIYINGMVPTTTSPMALALARASTLEVTPTALAAPATDGPAIPNATALASVTVPFTAAGTGPLRSIAVTDARLNVGINAAGGAYRWNAQPTQQWTIIGNAAGAGETILSNLPFGTPGAINVEMMYEPY